MVSKWGLKTSAINLPWGSQWEILPPIYDHLNGDTMMLRTDGMGICLSVGETQQRWEKPYAQMIITRWNLKYPLVIKRGWEIPELLMVDSWDNHQQMMGGTHCHV